MKIVGWFRWDSRDGFHGTLPSTASRRLSRKRAGGRHGRPSRRLRPGWRTAEAASRPHGGKIRSRFVFELEVHVVFGCLIELGISFKGRSRRPRRVVVQFASCRRALVFSAPPAGLASTRKPSVRSSVGFDHGGSVLQPGKHLHLGAKIAADLDFANGSCRLSSASRPAAFGFENEGVCGKDHRPLLSLSVNFTAHTCPSRARRRHWGFAVRY